MGPMARWERDREAPETVSVLVQRTVDGERLKSICKSRGWPHAVVAQHIAQDEGLSKALTEARRIYAEDMAMETPAIADDNADKDDVPGAKHRTDVRFKLAALLDRERFGQQVQHLVTVDPFSEMLRRVSEKRLQTLRLAQQPEKVIEALPEPVGDPI